MRLKLEASRWQLEYSHYNTATLSKTFITCITRMFLDCGRKPGYQERTHGDNMPSPRRKTAGLGIEPVTFLL